MSQDVDSLLRPHPTHEFLKTNLRPMALLPNPTPGKPNMPLIENILFPVDFSPACIAMAAYVKRAAAIMNSKVSLIHVVDLASHNGFELYLRPGPEISDEHRVIGRQRLDSFLASEFPLAGHSRILAFGDAASEIARTARTGRFDLIIMPTHAGVFRHMLLGSTTAKVLNDADCPVLTGRHAESIAPRPFEHREWLCAVGLTSNSERVLRFATQAAAEVRARLTILHAVQSGESDDSIKLNLEEGIQSAEKREAMRRIAELQQIVGSDLPVRIGIGSVKNALLEAARKSDADALMIGRSPHPGVQGRLRDLTYAMIRDSPYPVLSI
jgi:nucleotide-binding universal stress UspA family protein